MTDTDSARGAGLRIHSNHVGQVRECPEPGQLEQPAQAAERFVSTTSPLAAAALTGGLGMTEEEFTAERRTGVGGSDAAAVLGISPWQTPYDLYMQKIGEGEPLQQTERMLWGSLLEPVIADEYSRRTGRTLRLCPMLRHDAWPWMIGHIDGAVIGEPRIVEIKTSGTAAGWGEPGTDEIPLQYICQVQHYLALTGAQIADVAVLIGGSDFRIYQIEADDNIAGALVDAEHAFWQHVVDRDPPDPVNVRDAVQRWGRLANAGAVVASEADAQAIDSLRKLRALKAELEGQEEIAKVSIMKALSERGDTLVDLAGTPLATWKLDRGRAAYSVAPRPPARKFLLKD